MKNSFLLVLVACLFSFPVYALQGVDTSPGDACSVEDAIRMTANPSGSGGYILTCEGGVWVATLSGELPTEDEQVATKAYVDSKGGMTIQNPEDCDDGESPVYAAATGNWWCPNPCAAFQSPTAGTVCDDGTIYVDGTIYTTPSDQSSSAYWGTYGYTTNTVSTTDGAANSATVYADVIAGNGSYNPDDGREPNAFVLCHDLVYGGHDDWYLPAKGQLGVLYSNNAAIGNFDTSGTLYWSSTESSFNTVNLKVFSGGFNVSYPKSDTHAVRCVRSN